MGTEEFWVPAVLAAVSTGAQYANQSVANTRQQKAESTAIQDQQQIKDRANSNVNQLVDQIGKNSPNNIAAAATGDYVNTLRKNAAAGPNSGFQTFGQSTASTPAVPGASSRYNTSVANGNAQVQNYGNTEANELGQIDAATRQRQNEGLSEQTLGTNLGVLNGGSQMQSFVDQLRAQAAGQTNPWVSLGSAILGQYASGKAKNAGSNTSPGYNPVYGEPT